MLRTLHISSILLLFCSFSLLQQETIPISSYNISVDEYGNLYTTDSEGNIYKYDEILIKNSYSSISQSKITSIQNNSINFSAFYKDLQVVKYFDRFLTEKATFDLQDFDIGFAQSVSQALDNNLWVYDESNISLNKIDTRNKKLLLKNSLVDILSDDAEITEILEYQNLLILLSNKKGIYLFDNQGSFKNFYLLEGIKSLCGYQSKVFFLTDASELQSFDPYTFDSEDFPIEKKYTTLAANTRKLYLSNHSQVDVYELAK